MILLKFIFGFIIGILLWFFTNLVFAKKLENAKYRQIANITSFFILIILSSIFIVFSVFKNFTSNFLSTQIENIENEIDKIYPGLSVQEYNTAEINELSSQISDIIEELESDETYGWISGIAFQVFEKNIPTSVQSLGKSALNFLKENETISIDFILQITKTKTEKILNRVWFIGRLLVVFVFLIYLIIYACVILYLKKGNKLYNNSLNFGEDERSSN